MIELTQRQRSQAFRALLDVYRAEGRTVWFRGQGQSMTPLIWPNDVLLVELGVVPAGLGDIVLFRLNDRMIAHVSRWSGRSASKIGRFADHLPAGVQASAMCLIPLTARATAQALWTPLQWMARISLTTIFIG